MHLAAFIWLLGGMLLAVPSRAQEPLREEAGDPCAVELTESRRAFYDRNEVTRLWVLATAEREVAARRVDPTRSLSTNQMLADAVFAAGHGVDGKKPSAGAVLRWLDDGLSADDLAVRRGSASARKADAKLAKSQEQRDWAIAKVRAELQALSEDPKQEISTNQELADAVAAQFPDKKVFTKDGVRKWLDENLGEAEKAARGFALEALRKKRAAKTLTAKKEERNGARIAAVLAMVREELRLEKAEVPVTFRTLLGLSFDCAQGNGDEEPPAEITVLRWLNEGLTAEERAAREAAIDRRRAENISAALSAAKQPQREWVSARIRAELAARRVDPAAVLSTPEQLAEDVVTAVGGTMPERTTIHSWFESELLVSEREERVRQALIDRRTTIFEAYRQKRLVEGEWVRRYQAGERDGIPNLERIRMLADTEQARDFLMNEMAREEVAIADGAAVRVRSIRDWIALATERYPGISLRDEAVSELLRDAYSESEHARRAAVMHRQRAEKFPDAIRSWVLEEVRRDLREHEAGRTEVLQSAKDLARAARAHWGEKADGLEWHLVGRWLRDYLDAEALEYRFVNRARHRNVVEWDGISYDSYEEAAVSVMLQRYLGYVPKKRETLQISVGRQEVDFLVGERFIEYHRILLFKDESGRGDFENVDQAKAFRAALEAIPLEEPEARAALRARTAAALTEVYRSRRAALVGGRPLVVVVSPEDLYDRLLLPEAPAQLPERAAFLLEFNRQVRAISAATP